jgi:hypothetical protein
MNVVLLAHSHVKKFELPDGAGAFDRYELKLSRQVGPLVREWCDALLFGNWKTKIRERDDGNKQTTYKGIGGKERMLYCSHAAAWDAKNRHGLKDEEPWSKDTVARCLGGDDVVTKPEPIKPVKESQPKPAGNAAPPASKTTNVAGPSNGAASAASAAVASPSLADTDGIPGLPADNGGPQEHALTAIVGEHEAAVNEYLFSRKVIQQGQTYRDLKPDYIAKVQKSPQGFMAQALKGKGVAA